MACFKIWVDLFQILLHLCTRLPLWKAVVQLGNMVEADVNYSLQVLARFRAFQRAEHVPVPYLYLQYRE